MSAHKNVRFNSQVKEVSKFATELSNDLIKNEPMFFNSDIHFAYENGGEITKSFIDALPQDWRTEKTVFDSRVHMLMPGWFPAIPGYHHDDVPRPKIPVGQHFATAGQPDYDNMRYHSEHILGLVNAHVSPTVFACGFCEMPVINEGELVYRKWHETCEQLLKDGKLTAIEAQDRTLYQFD